MRTKTFTIWAVAAVVAAISPRPTYAQDQDLSLVINPRTGATSIHNDISSMVSIDGYLLTSSQGVFNPAGWSSLTDIGTPGWQEGPAAANRLGEANLFSSLAVNGGASLSLGLPYLPFSPTQIGQLEPSLNFEYHLAGIGSRMGDVVFAPQNNVVLLVDPSNGSASLQNQSLFNVNIDGLLITSPTDVLDPVGWNGLAESGVPGWTMGAAANNRLGEGNLFGSTFLAAGGAPVSIGSPINELMISDETDLVFEYHIAGGGSVSGGVVFVAAAAAPVQGDYNGNGQVDAADYTRWRDHLGQTFQLQNEGSGVSPGTVTMADYDFWVSHFGQPGAGAGGGGLSAASVPEPASWVFAALVGVVMYVRRHRPL
jgi:hypothetical protein